MYIFICLFYNIDDKLDEKWIVFDGPVDTLWIESMNSVMDDNKILTLINGERINMPDQVSLLFEIEDLAVASPATVSRAGMVFADYVDMGWKPYVESWLETKDTVNQKKGKAVQRMRIHHYYKLLLWSEEQSAVTSKSVISFFLCSVFQLVCTRFAIF